MPYKNHSFRNLFIDICFRLSLLIMSVITVIAGLFHLYFESLFFPVVVIFIMLFILLYITFYLYLNKTLISSNRFISLILILILFFLWFNTIYFLVKALRQLSLIELLTEPLIGINVFYTLDGFNFPELRYITIFNCLIKSLFFFLISILILILKILINFKHRFRLSIDSIHVFLIISNLAFSSYIYSSFLYHLWRSFGFLFRGFPCEILIHNYNYFILFFGILLYILITLFLFVLPLTSGVNISLALVKEILFIDFIYFLSYFHEYTTIQTDCFEVFISYPFLIFVLTAEIYSFPFNMSLF